MNPGYQREQSFDLDNERGFVNIGSHPANDVVVVGDQILPFHLMIDCRQEPYLLIPLSRDSAIRINDQAASGLEAISMGRDDLIQLGSLALKLHPRVNGTPASISLTETGSANGYSESGYQSPPSAAAVLPGTLARPLKPGEDYLDEIVMASLAEKSQVIAVEQTAVYALTITNASPVVSTFNIQVDGVPAAWVVVSPQNVNLNESSQAQVYVSITPPRRPTSAAGLHPLRFRISSYNHPERLTILNAALEISPYFDFTIGEMIPQNRAIGWGSQAAEVKMQVANQGNSDTPFVLTARDEDEKCRFQFLGDDGLRQSGEVQLSIPPGETQPVPVFVSPLKRLFIAWRSPRYNYRVAVSQPENNSLLLYSIGSVVIRPLIGFLGILLLVLSLLGLTVYLFIPRITTFNVDDNAISEGGSTTLRWKVALFTHNLQVTGLEEPIRGAQGNLMIYPANTVNTYTLNASTWLWNMLGLKPKTQSFTVLVLPSEPRIKTFTLNKTDQVLHGDNQLLRWSVEDANKVILTINGVSEVLEDQADFNGERELLVTQDTLIYLEAYNSLSAIARSLFFQAKPPEIDVLRFETSKKTIYKGDPITIYWEVAGAGMEDGGEVTISGFDGVLPNQGELTFFPTESMEFVLTARNRTIRETHILPVGVLEPEEPPPPPVIDFFTAAPDTITGPGSVELAWSVSGIVNKVTITNGSTIVADNLSAQGFRSISVDTSGTYVITAFQGDKSVGANLKITVNPAMQPPLLKVVSAFPNTNLSMGDTSKISITIAQPTPADPPPTGTVIVTDGSSSCTITLPETSCNLVFQTAGLKTIVATFQGDGKYLSAEARYADALDIAGISTSLNANVRNPTQTDNARFEYGERLDLTVNLVGTKTAFKPDGILRLTRYQCDENKLNCVAAINQPKENFHEFTAQENGNYTFAELLTLDALDGYTEIRISFDNDSFYNRSNTSVYIAIDPLTKSPVSLSADRPDTMSYQYTINVRDENIFGFYSPPAGTVSVTAVHTDATRVHCNNIPLSPNDDKRSSSAVCTLAPTQKGTWNLSVTYTPDSVSPHLARTASAGAFITTASVYIALAPDSPVLYTGVPSQMSVKVSDSIGAVVSMGSLVFSYGGVTKPCTYIGEKWLCDTIKPVEDHDLPIIFNFSPHPSEQAYLMPQVQPYYNLVKSPVTRVGSLTMTNSTLVVPPYIPDIAYPFMVNVSNDLTGDPPATGEVEVKLVDSADECTVDTTREFSLSVSGGRATGSINFVGTDAGLKTCYRFAGNEGYQPSEWATTTFDVRKLAARVSNLRAVNTTIAPPPYLPGTSYEFWATITSLETSGEIPASGNVVVKLVPSGNSCVVDSDRQFTLLITDKGTASGSIRFIEADAGLKTCYAFTGNAAFAPSDWETTTLDIRKLHATVGYLQAINAIIKPPPYLPTVNYTFQTNVTSEVSSLALNGIVEVKLVDSSLDCDTSSDRTFNMILGANNITTGDFTFLLPDNGKVACYRFTGDSNHSPSAWARTGALEVRGLATSVSGLSAINPSVPPPPYIPGVSYNFQATVSNAEPSGGTPPTTGTVTVKLVNSACSESSTRLFSLGVGDRGIATGEVIFLESDASKKICYAYSGGTTYAASPWVSVTTTIRKLTTSVTSFDDTVAGSFPPSSFAINANYAITAKVNETDGKGTTIPAGGEITVKTIPASSSCATTTGSYTIAMPVSSGGLASGTLTFPSTLNEPSYKMCYRYEGSNIHAASSWVQTASFSIEKRSSTTSGLGTIPATFTVGTAYTLTATTADNDTAPAVTPTGGSVDLYLVASSVGSTNQCTTTNLLGSLTVTGGAATGSVTFTANRATGSQWRICYRYSGGTYHSVSPWVLSGPFYVKLQSALTGTTVNTEIAATDDLTAPYSHTDTIYMQMTTAGAPTTSAVRLVDSTNTAICGSAEIKSDVHVCTAATTSNPVSGETRISWSIALKTARTLTLTPKFDGDDRHLGFTGTPFTLTSKYQVRWVSAAWAPTGSALVAYVVGEPDNMTTTFTGSFKFDYFTAYDYAAGGLAPALIPADTFSGGACTVTNASPNATITCSGVGVVKAATTTVNLKLNPAAPTNYSSSLTSPNIAMSVLGNITEQGSGPKVVMGCIDERVKFDIEGYASLGRTDFENEMRHFEIALACEKNNGDDTSWQVLRTMNKSITHPIFGTLTANKNATITASSYDPITGKFTMTIRADSNAEEPEGCGFDTNHLRFGLYFNYIPPSGPNDETDGNDEYTLESNFVTTSLYADVSGTHSSTYDDMYDIGPEVFTDDGDNWQDCPNGVQEPNPIWE